MGILPLVSRGLRIARVATPPPGPPFARVYYSMFPSEIIPSSPAIRRCNPVWSGWLGCVVSPGGCSALFEPRCFGSVFPAPVGGWRLGFPSRGTGCLVYTVGWWRWWVGVFPWVRATGRGVIGGGKSAIEG